MVFENYQCSIEESSPRDLLNKIDKDVLQKKENNMKGMNVVCFGEILWDNLKEGKRLGGAPLNVCYHLNKFGVKSTIVSRVGADQNGLKILDELKSMGIDHKFCSIISSKATSVVNVITGANNQIAYEIVEDIAWDYIEYTDKLETLVKESTALVFGSLAVRSELSRQTLFRLIAKSKFRVFDVNLRRPYYSKELIFALLKKTDLLKLNEEEMCIISDWIGERKSEDVEQIKYLFKHFSNIKEILLTQGSLGATYFSNKDIFKIKAYPVKIKDTVGSGDSFLAAFIANKLKGETIQVALHQASALSSFVTGKSGACPEYNLVELLSGFNLRESLITQVF